MSTLCCATLANKDVFGGTPNTARETHALPIHLFAFQKRVKGGRKISDNPKNFGNISDKRPFSENISDLFFAGGLPRQARRAVAVSSAVLSAVVLTKVEADTAKEDVAKAGQSGSKRVKPIWSGFDGLSRRSFSKAEVSPHRGFIR
jgi:hypothetical protein